MTSPSPIFDPALGALRLSRAAASPEDFLLRRIVDDLVERLGAVRRPFARIADVGTPTGALAQAVARALPDAPLDRVAPGAADDGLGLGDARFDLVLSALALQGVNDLPGVLAQIRRALVPDGLFLAALAGGRTLHELRRVLTEAETAVLGGASPRVAPFADVRDVGGLLQRAGFSLPVVDSETIVVRYDDLFALMADLRAMGATNTLVARSRRPTPRALFLEAARLYARDHSDPDGRIRATFEIVSLAGWAPHPSQAAPAKRGSAKIGLAEALATMRDWQS